MRRRTIAALAIVGAIASVVAFQAVIADPPEPYVEIVGRIPAAPVIVYSCDARGRLMMQYITSDGARFDPIPSGEACADLDPTTPAR